MRPDSAPDAREERYLLGTDAEEKRRLETQHRLWAEWAHDLWDRAGFGPGDRLLDLGCGPGFAAPGAGGARGRWLFCFLPEQLPIIERVVSGLRPGGRLVVWDYLNYRATALHPRSRAFERVLAAVDESWRRTGCDEPVRPGAPGNDGRGDNRLAAAADCATLRLMMVRSGESGTLHRRPRMSPDANARRRR